MRWLLHEARPTRFRTRALAMMAALPPLSATVRAARMLDHAMVPALRHTDVVAPLFVIGHPRSGTTFLHRLLALDHARFTTAEAWQALFPSIVAQRVIRQAMAWRGGAHPLGRLAADLGDRLFAAAAPFHASGWREPEEDSLFLLHLCAAIHLTSTAEPDVYDPTWLADLADPEATRRWMAWYRASVRRHLADAANGPPGRTYLSKSPQFTGWIRGLTEAFPDARFVMLVRDPEEAVASYLRGRLGLLLAFRPDARTTDPALRAAVARSATLYRHAEALWGSIPASQRHRVRYVDLVRDPAESVRSIYAHFRWSLPSGMLGDPLFSSGSGRIPRRAPPLRSYGMRRRDVEALLGGLREQIGA